MPKGNYEKTKESIVPLRGVVRNGKLVSVLDHEGTEVGALVTAQTNLTGGIDISGLFTGGVTTVIAGDSRTQQNIDQSATAIEARPRWFNLLNAMLGQPFDLIGNAGVNGDTCTGLLARINSAGVGTGFGGIGNAGLAVTTSPGVLPLKPRVVFECAGYNDIFGQNKTADQVWADKKAFYTSVLQSGALLVAMTVVAPYNTASGYTTANVAELLKLNGYIRAFCRTVGQTKLIDAYAACVDKTSANVEGPTNDFRDANTHNNNVGDYKIALAGVDVLGKMFPARTVLPVSNAETYALAPSIPWICANPLLTGTAAITATGFTGTTAGSTLANANFSRTGSMSVVLSAESRAIGATSYAPTKDGYGQNIRAAITATAAGENMQITLPSEHSKVITGGKYIAVCEAWASKAFNNTDAQPTPLAVADNCAGIQVSAQFTIGGTNYFTRDLTWQSTDKAYFGNLKLTLKSPVLELPAGAITVARPFVNVYASGAGTFEVQFGRIDLVKVG